MSSSEYLPILPQELLEEILSWVPVKALMRFKCVSKSWNSFVVDPNFIKLHLQRSSKNTHILLTFEDHSDKSKYCAPCSAHDLLENPSSTIDACRPFKHNYKLLGVSNGLVCLQDSYGLKYEFVEYWVRFWNPATRVISKDSPHVRLCWGNYKYPNFYNCGFGYDDWSETYQVVLLDNKSHKMKVRVHCLGDTHWRNVLTCPTFPILTPYGVFVSGTVNWLALLNSSSRYQWDTVAIDELVIFSYDLKNETYRYLSMPGGLHEVPPYPPTLQVLKGCLCLCHHHRRTHFGFWLMREFGVENSWTHLLNISYEQLHIRVLIHGFPPLLPVILCMSRNYDVMLLVNKECQKFTLYNERDNRIDRYGDFDEGRFEFLSYDYVQSLVMPY